MKLVCKPIYWLSVLALVACSKNSSTSSTEIPEGAAVFAGEAPVLVADSLWTGLLSGNKIQLAIGTQSAELELVQSSDSVTYLSLYNPDGSVSLFSLAPLSPSVLSRTSVATLAPEVTLGGACAAIGAMQFPMIGLFGDDQQRIGTARLTSASVMQLVPIINPLQKAVLEAPFAPVPAVSSILSTLTSTPASATPIQVLSAVTAIQSTGMAEFQISIVQQPNTASLQSALSSLGSDIHRIPPPIPPSVVASFESARTSMTSGIVTVQLATSSSSVQTVSSSSSLMETSSSSSYTSSSSAESSSSSSVSICLFADYAAFLQESQGWTVTGGYSYEQASCIMGTVTKGEKTLQLAIETSGNSSTVWGSSFFVMRSLDDGNVVTCTATVPDGSATFAVGNAVEFSACATDFGMGQ